MRPIKKFFTKPKFDGKLIWITGASSGIGEEMAKQMSNLGATLILSSRNEKEMNRVKNLCKNSDKHIIFPLDLSKPREVMEKTTEFIANLEKEGKKIDIIVENAGNSQRASFMDTDFETHQYLTDLNYNGPVAHAKAFLPHLIKNKSGQIVIVSSVAGKISSAMRSSYAGAKHAVIGFFDSVRSEVHEHNISVTSILPGYVQTNISKNAMTGPKGQTLGKTDANIASGLTVESFTEDSIFSIYTKEVEFCATSEFKQDLAIILRNISPSFVANGVAKNAKQQMEAIKKAQ